MVKKFLAILGMSGCLFCANAVDPMYMTIEKYSGSKYSFLLEESLIARYKDGNLVINDDEKVSFELDSIKIFHFTSQDESGVNSLDASLLRVVFIDDARLQVENASASEKITLLNVNGVVVSTMSTNSEGSAMVTLPEQKGVYLLTVGSLSIKVIRK